LDIAGGHGPPAGMTTEEKEEIMNGLKDL